MTQRDPGALPEVSGAGIKLLTYARHARRSQESFDSSRQPHDVPMLHAAARVSTLLADT